MPLYFLSHFSSWLGLACIVMFLIFIVHSYVAPTINKLNKKKDFLYNNALLLILAAKFRNLIPPIASPFTEFIISDEKILSTIRSLNPNKAHGWDTILIRTTELCDDALLLPPRLIFENCLNQGILPDMWKSANVVPIHKQNHKS